MLAVGLILAVIAILVLITALLGGSNDPAPLQLGPVELDLTVTGAFLMGAGTVLVFVMGLELIRSGTRKGFQRRRDQRELKRLQRQQRKSEGGPRSDSGDQAGARDAGTSTDQA